MGCSPTENISRRIVEAIKARMPWGLGSAMTMARETSMAVHSSPDQCGSSVPGKTRWGVTAPWRTVTDPHGLRHTSGFVNHLWPCLSQLSSPNCCPGHNESHPCFHLQTFTHGPSTWEIVPFLVTVGLSLDVTSSGKPPASPASSKHMPGAPSSSELCSLVITTGYYFLVVIWHPGGTRQMIVQ